mmetsp:Transcript_74207/g.111811  ORF Transcript_74207/g.111811 Transcript_74207/m.111811 type:complete len:271 (+) Transcript_74207:846-1658(+)
MLTAASSSSLPESVLAFFNFGSSLSSFSSLLSSSLLPALSSSSSFCNRLLAREFMGATFLRSVTKKPPVSISCGNILMHRSNLNLAASSAVGGKFVGRMRRRKLLGSSSMEAYSFKPDNSIIRFSSSSSIVFGANVVWTGTRMGASPSDVSASGDASSFLVSPFSSLSSLGFSSSAPSAAASPFSTASFLLFSSHSFRRACILALFFFKMFLVLRLLLSSLRTFQVDKPGRERKPGNSFFRSTNSKLPSEALRSSATTASFSMGFIEHVE